MLLHLSFLILINSLEHINEDISNQDILCGYNDDCIIYCDINNAGNCRNANITCQNSDDGVCELTCIGSDACKDLSIDTVNSRSVKINCGPGIGMIKDIYELYAKHL